MLTKCLSKKLDFTHETGKYVIAWLESSFDDLLVCQGHPEKETSVGSCGHFHDNSLEILHEPEHKSCTGQGGA